MKFFRERAATPARPPETAQNPSTRTLLIKGRWRTPENRKSVLKPTGPNNLAFLHESGAPVNRYLHGLGQFPAKSAIRSLKMGDASGHRRSKR
jgi:hypothetical protein